MSKDMTFEQLADSVKNVHEATSAYAKGAVNQLLTARNWAIGCYIVEFEQNGKERAEYGSSLLKVSRKLKAIGKDDDILPFRLGDEQLSDCSDDKIISTVSHKFETPPELLLTRLSFSHIREIMVLDDPLERFFYEVECSI